MIISPPFLPTRDANETDDAYLDRAMVAHTHGRYPVSQLLGWHGGVHLTAPASTGTSRLPVRAIADGTVAYVRQPTAMPADPTEHPLGYNGWTDDGCVVIRHETTIGANSDGETTVQFYSIYLHLNTILSAATAGETIHRKTELGRAGMFEGEAGIIHFEIICDDENVRRLIGRNSGEVDTATDGRTDTVFGEMYFKIPAGTASYAARPALHELAGSNAGELDEELFVGIRYESGSARVTTYRNNGMMLGDALVEADAEYNLYRDSGRIVTAYRTATEPTIPVHSAVYELLRFGRALGPDALIPADTPHWRQIRTPAGQAWVNLNAANVTKYSDADAPQWAGWSVLEDYQDGDSRCSIDAIRSMLDADGDGVTTATEAESRMGEESVQRFMRGIVAKFPTEWHRASVADRWKWLTRECPAGSDPNSLSASTHLSQDDFPDFQRHAEALCFWEDADLGVEAAHWHFHPKKFILHFRSCGWLNSSELQRIFPRAAAVDIERFLSAINLVMRKYLGESVVRRSHFLGQTGHETGNLSGPMAERGNSRASREYETDNTYFQGPDTYRYFQPGAGYERVQNTLGNEYSPDGTGDGIKFRGRGSLQITGRAHYSEYWVYRGWLDPGDFDSRWWAMAGWWDAPRNTRIRPAIIGDPQRISARENGNEYNPIDVGGDYWVRSALSQACDPENAATVQALRSDHVSRIINRYDTPTFPARRQRVETAKMVLSDGL